MERIDRIQEMVSDFVENNSPVGYDTLRDYLKIHNIPKKEIRRVLEEEIIELPLYYGISFLSPFNAKKKLPPYTKRKVLNYNKSIVVIEKTEKRLAGLIPPPVDPGLIPPSKKRSYIEPSFDTEITIISKEYHFRPSDTTG